MLVISKANKRAVHEAFDTYKEGMRSKQLPYADYKSLKDAHEMFFELAEIVFMDIAVNVDKKGSVFSTFKDQIEQEFKLIEEQESPTSIDSFEGDLETLYVDVNYKIATGRYRKTGGYKEYKDDVEQIRKKLYNNNNCLGRQKESVYKSYVEKLKYEEVMICDVDKESPTIAQQMIVARTLQKTPESKAIDMDNVLRGSNLLHLVDVLKRNKIFTPEEVLDLGNADFRAMDVSIGDKGRLKKICRDQISDINGTDKSSSKGSKEEMEYRPNEVEKGLMKTGPLAYEVKLVYFLLPKPRRAINVV